jgi:hypothetical protein
MAEHDDVGRSESTQTQPSLQARLRSGSYAKPSFPMDARDAMLKAADEIEAWRNWAARYYERCEEAGPDEYEYIRNEMMEMCRPYAERSGST